VKAGGGEEEGSFRRAVTWYCGKKVRSGETIKRAQKHHQSPEGEKTEKHDLSKILSHEKKEKPQRKGPVPLELVQHGNRIQGYLRLRKQSQQKIPITRGGGTRIGVTLRRVGVWVTKIPRRAEGEKGGQ